MCNPFHNLPFFYIVLDIWNCKFKTEIVSLSQQYSVCSCFHVLMESAKCINVNVNVNVLMELCFSVSVLMHCFVQLT